MTERFSPVVAEALRAGGWQPGRRDLHLARQWGQEVETYVSPSGLQHTVVQPAIEAYAEFGQVAVHPEGAGEQVAPSRFIIDPLRILQAVQVTATLAADLGVPLTPLGEENDGAGLITIDAFGRVFVADHTAEWFLGATLDEAFEVLIRGLLPKRIRTDGTWSTD
jgi:hypothetical protein